MKTVKRIGMEALVAIYLLQLPLMVAYLVMNL